MKVTTIQLPQRNALLIDILSDKHYKALEFLALLGCEVSGLRIDEDVKGGSELWIMSEQRTYALMEVNGYRYSLIRGWESIGKNEDMIELAKKVGSDYENIKAEMNEKYGKFSAIPTNPTSQDIIIDIPVIATENLTTFTHIHPAILAGQEPLKFTPLPLSARSTQSSALLTTRHLFALAVLDTRGVQVYGKLPGVIEWFMPFEQAEKLLSELGYYYNGLVYVWVGTSEDDEDTQEYEGIAEDELKDGFCPSCGSFSVAKTFESDARTTYCCIHCEHYFEYSHMGDE